MLDLLRYTLLLVGASAAAYAGYLVGRERERGALAIRLSDRMLRRRA